MNTDRAKNIIKEGARRFLVLKREEQALVLIATITVSSIGGMGVAQAKGGVYQVDVAGHAMGAVKNVRMVDAAIDLAKEDYARKTGKQAVRPVVHVNVEKEYFSKDKDNTLNMRELADRLSKEVHWVVDSPAIVLEDGTAIAVVDEETAKAVLADIQSQAEVRDFAPAKNDEALPQVALENADAEMSKLELYAPEQPQLGDTSYELKKTGLYDGAKVDSVEVPDVDIFTKEEALAYIKNGRMVPHTHVLAKGEDTEKIADLWGMTPETVAKLNPQLEAGDVNPGAKIKVERKEPVVRDVQLVREVRQHYTPFQVSYVDDPSMTVGEYQVETPGKAGVKTTTSDVERVAGFEQSRTVISETYNQAPENAIVRRGTAEGPGVIWPLKGVLTSPFGVRVWGNGLSEFHRGIDIAAPTGTSVRAAKSGIVTYAGEMGSYGNVVFIDHGNGFSTRYAHLSAINCKVGDNIKMGDVLGLVGSTGNSTGPHLHFETLINNIPKNPMNFLKDGNAGVTSPSEDYEAYMKAYGNRTVKVTDQAITVTAPNGQTATTPVEAPAKEAVTPPVSTAGNGPLVGTDVLPENSQTATKTSDSTNDKNAEKKEEAAAVSSGDHIQNADQTGSQEEPKEPAQNKQAPVKNVVRAFVDAVKKNG